MWTKNLRIRVAEDGSLQDLKGIPLQIPELRPGIYEMVCVLQAIPQEESSESLEESELEGDPQSLLEMGHREAPFQARRSRSIPKEVSTPPANMAQALGLSTQDLRLQGSAKDSFEAPSMQISIPSEGIDPFAESGLA